MQPHHNNTGMLPGARLLLFAFLLISPCLYSCEDDPIVEPKQGAKAGGSYGGRLALPDQQTTTHNAGERPVTQTNPELF